MHNYVLFDIIVDLNIQKLKNKHTFKQTKKAKSSHFDRTRVDKNQIFPTIDFKLYYVKNPNPKPLEDVKLYVSDPWAPSFTSHGIISNLEVTDLDQNPPIAASDGK